jgi:riboflavin kinase/FMN adenylyltransferase
VEAADFASAERGLGRPYSALGRVEPGAGRGRGLGFPTANVRLDDARKCLPPDGVYAVRVEIEGMLHDGMANLGARPTFGETERGLEAHLFDWNGEALYGARPLVEFVARLRPTTRFEGPAQLAAQLERDREAALDRLGRSRKRSSGVV